MAIQNQLASLSSAAQKLNKLSDELDELVDAVNRTLRETAPQGPHVHRVPLSEECFEGPEGREIVMEFVVFKDIRGLRQLGIVQRRVFESRAQGQLNQNRQVETPLILAGLSLQQKAIEFLPAFVNTLRTDGGHSLNVDDIFDDAPTRLVQVQVPKT